VRRGADWCDVIMPLLNLLPMMLLISTVITASNDSRHDVRSLLALITSRRPQPDIRQPSPGDIMSSPRHPRLVGELKIPETLPPVTLPKTRRSHSPLFVGRHNSLTEDRSSSPRAISRQPRVSLRVRILLSTVL